MIIRLALKQTILPTSPIEKNKLFITENWLGVTRSSPVAWSRTPPVACWYCWKALLARRRRVVPVSNECSITRYTQLDTMVPLRTHNARATVENRCRTTIAGKIFRERSYRGRKEPTRCADLFRKIHWLDVSLWLGHSESDQYIVWGQHRRKSIGHWWRRRYWWAGKKFPVQETRCSLSPRF